MTDEAQPSRFDPGDQLVHLRESNSWEASHQVLTKLVRAVAFYRCRIS